MVIFKYLDDTKLISKVKPEDNIERTQNTLNHIYQWQIRNNMSWKQDKFVRVSRGKNEVDNSNMIFTPNYEDPISQEHSTTDLGIIIDNDCSFRSQRKAAIVKTNQRYGWVLRTFQTRDPQILCYLWRTLC